MKLVTNTSGLTTEWLQRALIWANTFVEEHAELSTFQTTDGSRALIPRDLPVMATISPHSWRGRYHFKSKIFVGKEHEAWMKLRFASSALLGSIKFPFVGNYFNHKTTYADLESSLLSIVVHETAHARQDATGSPAPHRAKIFHQRYEDDAIMFQNLAIEEFAGKTLDVPLFREIKTRARVWKRIRRTLSVQRSDLPRYQAAYEWAAGWLRGLGITAKVVVTERRQPSWYSTSAGYVPPVDIALRGYVTAEDIQRLNASWKELSDGISDRLYRPDQG